MAFLNTNNFCKWLDPVNTIEFTKDGSFAKTDAPDWNLSDDAVIGNSEVAFAWDPSSGGILKADDLTQTFFDSKGLSQSLNIKKGNIYCFDTHLHNGRASETIFYFYFVSGNNNQLVKTIVTNNDTEFYKFFIKADSNYSKVMVVIRNAGDMILTDVRDLKIYEFDECFYSLPLYKGDGLNIFVNAVLDNTVDVFSQLKVGLWNENGIYLRDIANLNQIVISGDNYSMYLDEWIVPDLPSGIFRFIIYDDSGGFDLELYLSNSFQEISNKNYTSWIKYNNAVDTLNYLYSDVPSFYNEFRIDLWTGRPNYNDNVKGYETYEGDLIEVKRDIQKRIEFQTRFFDEGAHEAFFAMLGHSSIEIDGIIYKKGEQSYDIAWSEDDDNKIGNGIVNLLVEDYSAAIKTC